MKEKAPCSMIDAVKILDLLVTDDAFRDAFQESPGEALRKVSPEAAKAAALCALPGPLASKEDLAVSRARLVEVLASVGLFYQPYCFVDEASGQVVALAA